jgi:hypothetical protein
MSLWADLRSAIRHMTRVQERVEQLIADIEKTGERLLDHERRLVQVQTLIAVARRPALPP